MKRRLFTETKEFEFLHPDKNVDVDFSKIYDNSSLKIYWQCQKDERHVYEQKIVSKTRQGYGCPYCSGRKTLKEESLAAIHPQIAAELHPTKSTHFDPYNYSPSSNKKVTWLCSEGHEWISRVEERTRGKDTKCPICRKIEKSIANRYPSLVEEWDLEKNIGLDPKILSAASNKSIWWRCLLDSSHGSWKRGIKTRVESPSKGCPICDLEKVETTVAVKSKSYDRLPKLSEYSEGLCLEWHPTLNKTNRPSDFSAGSSKKVWWFCSSCQNEWAAIIRNRARKNQGCPACSKHTSRSGRSTLDDYPELIEQWHPTKNEDLKPESLSFGSAKKVWWQCRINPDHIWQEAVSFRTKKNSYECRVCKAEANSLASNYPEIADEWHPSKNGSLKPSDVSQSSGKKFWWRCSVNQEHEWEAQVRNRTTNNSNCKRCASEKIVHYMGHSGIEIDRKDVETYHVFETSLKSLSLLASYSFEKNLRLVQPVYRMIYSSVITSFESYLVDSFLNKVIGNSERVALVIKASDELREKKYSVEDVLDWHKNIESRVERYLNDIIWHNLYIVEKLYREVLNIRFPDDVSDIKRAIGIRHDIVHRNGKAKNGKARSFSESEVVALISKIEKMVSTLQSQLVKL